MADFEDNFKNYDSWLAEKEGGSVMSGMGVSVTPGHSKSGRGRTLAVSVTGGLARGPSAPMIRPQSTKTIIDGIVQRRKQDRHDQGADWSETQPGGFEAWLTGNIQPSHILEQVRSGYEINSIPIDPY